MVRLLLQMQWILLNIPITLGNSNIVILKELRNRITRIIRLRPLFCSIRVYASLHFLPILLEN